MSKTMQRSETRQELLDNTVNYFNSKNRAYDRGRDACKYRVKHGVGCAIGREISSKLARELDCGGAEGTAVNNKRVFSELPKRLQNMGKAFLSRIQRLHDGEDCWNDDGISKYGLDRVSEICNNFELVNNHNK